MIAQRIRALGEIPIYEFKTKCWKCGKGMDAITYLFSIGYDFSLGSIEKLDKSLGKRYPGVKEGHNKLLKKKVFMNTCRHCGTPTGNYFIMEIIVEEKKLNGGLSKFKVASLPTKNINAKDLRFTEEEFRGLLEMC